MTSSLPSSASLAMPLPSEEDEHEGTWLQWPHNRSQSNSLRYSKHDTVKRYEESWIQMVLALHDGERVHIVVWDPTEKERVSQLLDSRGCDMKQIDFCFTNLFPITPGTSETKF